MSQQDHDVPVPEHVREALRDARLNHTASLDALREAVCAYVDELRDRDVSRLAIVAKVRGVFRENGHHLHGPDGTHATIERMIQWCVDRESA
jgi:hypothetical protein